MTETNLSTEKPNSATEILDEKQRDRRKWLKIKLAALGVALSGSFTFVGGTIANSGITEDIGLGVALAGLSARLIKRIPPSPSEVSKNVGISSPEQKGDSVTKVLDEKQKKKQKWIMAGLAAFGISEVGGLGTYIGGSIANSTAAVDGGLIATSAGLLMITYPVVRGIRKDLKRTKNL